MSHTQLGDTCAFAGKTAMICVRGLHLFLGLPGADPGNDILRERFPDSGRYREVLVL